MNVSEAKGNEVKNESTRADGLIRRWPSKPEDLNLNILHCCGTQFVLELEYILFACRAQFGLYSV